MRLEKKLKKSLASRLLIEIPALLVCLVLFLPQPSLADPVISDLILPPASFTHIDDPETLRTLGLDGFGGAWCYDTEANAILITAPARIRANCELTMQYELEKQKAKYDFRLEKLNVRIETLKDQQAKINIIKDKEIERLTNAAMSRPNEYTAWWASGGFVVGALTTALIAYLVL